MGQKLIIGIDEVGRGPLAGPVTVGAAAFFTKNQKNVNTFLQAIKDSKKTSPRNRLLWRDRIVEFPYLLWSVSSVSARLIDKIGIADATRLAVGRCLKKISTQCGVSAENMYIMLDGSLYATSAYKNQKTIIRGDEKVPIISAASIIAKVCRDTIMTKYHGIFPEYQFDMHKGYGTRLHIAHIRRHGLCPLHRKTFCSNITV